MDDAAELLSQGQISMKNICAVKLSSTPTVSYYLPRSQENMGILTNAGQGVCRPCEAALRRKKKFTPRFYVVLAWKQIYSSTPVCMVCPGYVSSSQSLSLRLYAWFLGFARPKNPDFNLLLFRTDMRNKKLSCEACSFLEAETSVYLSLHGARYASIVERCIGLENLPVIIKFFCRISSTMPPKKWMRATKDNSIGWTSL
jgi:hypothetical protein